MDKMDCWIEDLPAVRGRYQFHEPLARHTWFRVGGAVDVLFRPADTEDLQHFLTHLPIDVAIHTMGAGSNLLIRDGGVSGVMIRLARGFNHISVDSIRAQVTVGAGCLDRTLAEQLALEGLGGLAFLVSIPGTIGGAIKMNAGCYGYEVQDVLLWVEGVTRTGKLQRYMREDLAMTYRKTIFPEDIMITQACFQGKACHTQEIQAEMREYLKARESTQPTRGCTGGSTFKNFSDRAAWSLIDQVGLRGYRMGDAQFSEKHCNFLLNLGAATATDLESLGELARERVQNMLGYQLEWEIMRLGHEHAPGVGK